MKATSIILFILQIIKVRVIALSISSELIEANNQTTSEILYLNRSNVTVIAIDEYQNGNKSNDYHRSNVSRNNYSKIDVDTINRRRIFIPPHDRVRNIVLNHLIKPEKRNFFGLILIPCEISININSMFNLLFGDSEHCLKLIYLQILCAFLLQKDFGHFFHQYYSIK